VSAFIALEGNYLGRIGTIGVGSVRWNVEVKGPGGHAWEAASAPSAIDMAARIVAALGDVAVEPGRRSVNVGKFTGGEAVNARARRASFVVDIRAVEPAELGRLVAECRQIILAPSAERMSVEIHEIGDRPAGAIDEQHPLVSAARRALERGGLSPVMAASSTDANAAHCRGVPGVALGVTFGAGEHTTEEWIELDSIAVGLRVLADTVVDYVSEVGNVRP
jgi:acetylornithine deacetylase/succinyl-diaminopimelate desuccinylase-like protein